MSISTFLHSLGFLSRVLTAWVRGWLNSKQVLEVKVNELLWEDLKACLPKPSAYMVRVTLRGAFSPPSKAFAHLQGSSVLPFLGEDLLHYSCREWKSVPPSLLSLLRSSFLLSLIFSLPPSLCLSLSLLTEGPSLRIWGWCKPHWCTDDIRCRLLCVWGIGVWHCKDALWVKVLLPDQQVSCFLLGLTD